MGKIRLFQLLASLFLLPITCSFAQTTSRTLIRAGHLPDVKTGAEPAHKKAIAAGVKVALGTDAAVYPHGLNAHEIDVYVNQFGMSPLAGIQTGTINAADLMGWTDKVGTLEPGKWADIIAVTGDPLKDVRILQHVNFVMKSGTIYKNESH